MSVPGYWMPEPDIPRITTKKEYRKDRLQCLGNAVVPQQFYPVFRAIAEIEGENYAAIEEWNTRAPILSAEEMEMLNV